MFVTEYHLITQMTLHRDSPFEKTYYLNNIQPVMEIRAILLTVVGDG